MSVFVARALRREHCVLMERVGLLRLRRSPFVVRLHYALRTPEHACVVVAYFSGADVFLRRRG